MIRNAFECRQIHEFYPRGGKRLLSYLCLAEALAATKSGRMEARNRSGGASDNRRASYASHRHRHPVVSNPATFADPLGWQVALMCVRSTISETSSR